MDRKKQYNVGSASQRSATTSTGSSTTTPMQRTRGAERFNTGPGGQSRGPFVRQQQSQQPQLKKNVPIELLTNFVELKQITGKQLYQYRLDFEPSDLSKRTKRELVRQYVEKAHFDSHFLFDGEFDAISPKLVNKKKGLTVMAKRNKGDLVTISIKFVGDKFDFDRLYNTNQKIFFSILDYYATPGGVYVNPSTTTKLDDYKLSIVRGFEAKANSHQDGKTLMNFNIAHKIFQQQSLAIIIKELIQTMDRRKYTSEDEFLNEQLQEKLIITNHNRRCYRIEKIDSKLSIKSLFDTGDAKKTSFKDYFLNKYGIQLKDPNQKMLSVRPANSYRRRLTTGDESSKQQSQKKGESSKQQSQKKSATEVDEIEYTIVVPSEICTLSGLTESQAKDFKLRRQLVTNCQLNPQQHVEMLQKFLQNFNKSDKIKDILNRWNYQYDNVAKQVKAIVLPTESIHWFKSKFDVDYNTANFDNHLVRSKLAIRPSKVSNITILSFNVANTSYIVDLVDLAFKQLGFDVKITNEFRTDRLGELANTLQSIRANGSVQLIMVIVPRQNKTVYDIVKKQLTINIGIPSQVVTSRLFEDTRDFQRRKHSGIAMKIAVQIATKIGAEPWHIDLPLPATMVCGYDTYHDTQKRGRSYGAFIASTNDKFSKWYSTVKAHERLEELSSDFAENLQKAVNNYKSINKTLPKNIIVFRDGVGDGQIQHVMTVELNMAKNKVKLASKDIKLTFVIVNKRIGARVYLPSGQPGTSTHTYTNPPPGTVVDSVITRASRQDFYLISQSTHQGTVSPTYYNVICNEMNIPLDKIQQIAFKLCLDYYNWTGGVRVPAPCQYAHKLALQTGENLFSAPHGSLSNSLHYL